MSAVKKVLIAKEDLPSIYRENSIVSLSGSVGSITGTGPWNASITGMSTTNGISVGDKISATNGTGSIGSGGSYVVTSVPSETSITFTATGGTTPTAGTVSNISILLLSYNIRYRLISEDRNRISPWSKVYNLKVPYIDVISEYSMVINNSHDLVTLTWNLDKVPETLYFDVWVRWVGNHAESNYPWQYDATVNSNQYSLVFPASIPDPVAGGTEAPKKIRVAVQRATFPKEKENYPTSSEITVFETALEVL